MIKVTGKGGISATIVADSVSSVSGDRITTFELEYHRFVHSELMTHRMFSRNAASSRAIPVKNMLELVRNSPAMPIHWGKNQAGMQAKEEVENWQGFGQGEYQWMGAACDAVKRAGTLAEQGYHKQIVNRLVEPFQMIKVVVTATSFDNFFWLRFHEDAQPEIKEVARCMLVAYKRSKPQELNPGEWHLPYVLVSREDDGQLSYRIEGDDPEEDGVSWQEYLELDEALKVSASCCAQVSYRKADNSLEKAEQVWERLVSSQPVHASPTEHQATPMDLPKILTGESEVECMREGYTHCDKYSNFWSNNFKGWIQHRALLAGNVCNNYDYGQEIDITDLVVEEV